MYGIVRSFYTQSFFEKKKIDEFQAQSNYLLVQEFGMTWEQANKLGINYKLGLLDFLREKQEKDGGQ